MSQILISIGDTKRELLRLIEAEDHQVRGAVTKTDQRYRRGIQLGLQTALETVDAAERSQTAGEAVPLRSAAEIIAELKGGGDG